MSNRQSVLIALQKHGKSTYDDLEQSTGIQRDKLRIAINDAKKAGHVDAGKDTVTGLPAYEISRYGVAWLEKNGPDKAEPEPAEMPTDKECCNAAKVVATTAGKEVSDLRNRIEELTRDRNAHRDDVLMWERTMMLLLNEDGIGSVTKVIENMKADIGHARIQIEALNEQLMHGQEAADVKEAAIGYLIRVPGKRSLIRSKPEGAHAAAMSSARAHGRADVLALVPIGKAVRGAEWRPK